MALTAPLHEASPLEASFVAKRISTGYCRRERNIVQTKDTTPPFHAARDVMTACAGHTRQHTSATRRREDDAKHETLGGNSKKGTGSPRAGFQQLLFRPGPGGGLGHRQLRTQTQRT